MHIRSTKNIFNCSLCWQITFGVFALILIVECVLLIPSAQRFRQVEKERIAQNIQIAIDQALVLDPSLITNAPQARGLATLVGELRLEGLMLRNAEGIEIARAGANNFSDAAFVNNTPTFEAMDGKAQLHEGAHDKLFATWKNATIGNTLLTASIDISAIKGDLNLYLLRIGGLVLIVVFVVTFGTMVLLYFMLLKPLLRLRESAIAAGLSPKLAATFALPLALAPGKKPDELEDLIEAHNSLLAQVTDSMQREAEYAESRRRHIERHDGLSGLPNKIALMEYLNHRGTEGGADATTPLTLFLIELRNHSISTNNLADKFGEALSRMTHARELVAQLGPSLFAMVRLTEHLTQHDKLDPLETSEARTDKKTEPNILRANAQLAEQIIRMAATYGASSSNTFLCDAHIGIVETMSGAADACDAAVLLSHAEFALNRARTDPATRYQFFDQASATAALDRQQLTVELQRAIREKEITVWYQPKVALQRGNLLCGAEALVRWPHPTRGLLSPALFVPLAEETGQIEALDLYVFDAVCAQLRDWHGRFQHVPRIAVNIAAETFARPQLADELMRVMNSTSGEQPSGGRNNARKILPTDIEIEITETAAMKNIEDTIATLAAIRKYGMHTAIDDFGTGYSSLSYLRRFDIDTLKIDRSFVEDIGTNSNVESICNVIVQLGRAIGTNVVAEGVETTEQADFLRARDCDIAQGYLFGRPISADEFAAAWLKPML